MFFEGRQKEVENGKKKEKEYRREGERVLCHGRRNEERSEVKVEGECGNDQRMSWLILPQS